jgi:hypothetical protein
MCSGCVLKYIANCVPPFLPTFFSAIEFQNEIDDSGHVGTSKYYEDMLVTSHRPIASLTSPFRLSTRARVVQGLIIDQSDMPIGKGIIRVI